MLENGPLSLRASEGQHILMETKRESRSLSADHQEPLDTERTT